MSSSSQTVPQPDHFYGQVESAVSPDGRGYLHPDDDPHAARGVPVFKPSMEEFLDFEQYMNKVECWGMKSGIIKIIPPKEWRDALPSTIPQLAKVKLRNPIEQEFVGSGGVFRQQNMEKRRIMSVREWVEQCAKDDLRSPTKYEVERGRRYITGPPSNRSRRSTRIPEDVVKLEDDDVKMSEAQNDHGCDEETADPDPTSSLPTPPHAPQSPTPDPSHPEDTTNSSTHPTSNRRSAAERHKAKEALDATFFASFDPHTSWLPKGIAPEDYTPEFCKALERMYWRSCGLGRSPWYGADMKGSLFTEETKHWNVATLPSVLSRLLGPNSQISGVNTPYLYFGMWRATFAWHVEDMDLFSINYIHFGSPKHWYAVPQARAQALETTMKGYFPLDTSSCPQFLRHKSFLASPSLLAKSSVKPNVLVQHAGEFVVTFPRGYHAGFNLGLNCAESTNFALDSWVELGLKAAFCGCVTDSVRIDVRGLIEAKRQRDALQNLPAKKRKVEVFIDNSKSKRSKMAPPSPESIADGPAPKAKSNKPRSAVTAATPSTASTDAEEPVFPCCLCVSLDTNGLLPVNDPPSHSSGLIKPRDGIWRAHETCARVIPETWVDEVTETGQGQGVTKVVWGVDGIVKDRWMLKCAACTRSKHKLHGAPIQCTKGKCSKAFHVSCAIAGLSDTSYRVTEETDKEVVLLEPEIAADTITTTAPTTATSTSASDDVSSSDQPANVLPDNQGPKVLKTIKKYTVEVLCSQHNPAMIAKRKASKDDKLRADVMALKEMDRIKIRNSSGAFEVSLVKVYEDRGTVEVLWDGGLKREFRWGSIVWNNDAQMAGRKPTAEEVKKNPPPPPAPVFATVRAVPPSSNQMTFPAGNTSLAGSPMSIHPQTMFISPVVRPGLQPQPTYTQSFLRLTPQHVHPHKPHSQAQAPQPSNGPTEKTNTSQQLPSASPSVNYAYGYPPYHYPYPYSYAPYQPYVGGAPISSPYPPPPPPPTSAADGSDLGAPAAASATAHDQASPVTTPGNPLANAATQISATAAWTSSGPSLPPQNAPVPTPTTASAPPNSAQLSISVPPTQQQHSWAYPYYGSPLTSASCSSSPSMVAGNHHLHLPPNMHAYYQQHYARLLNGGAGVTSAVLAAMNTTGVKCGPSSPSQTESSPTTTAQSVQQQQQQQQQQDQTPLSVSAFQPRSTIPTSTSSST